MKGTSARRRGLQLALLDIQIHFEEAAASASSAGQPAQAGAAAIYSGKSPGAAGHAARRDMPADGRPVLRAGHIDLDYRGSWTWQVSDLALLREVRIKVHQREQKTGAEIVAEVRNDGGGSRSTGHRKNKPIDTDQICAEAQQRLVSLGHNDVASLFEWSQTTERKLWMLFRNNYCYLLWYDGHHEVYPLARG